MDLEFLRALTVPNDTKILLLVADGLGGLPHPESHRSELEAANIQHLDRLAAISMCGLTVPVAPGITPGSGPGHLGLFGYDPHRYVVGRGVLEALGVDFDLRPEDVAARGNFCTVDSEGRIVDRRAGRIPTELCAELSAELANIRVPGVELFVQPVREHRFLFVMRGGGLSDRLSETDPQREGLPALPVQALDQSASFTADVANRFVTEAAARLRGRDRANMVLLRGFASHPAMPSLADICKLRAGAIAVYPMYRGLAKLVGMTVLPTGTTFADEIATLRERWQDFDFFFIHYKRADSAGEDGDFEAKMAALEELDRYIPDLLELGADVFMVAGDHSTPSVYGAHSWHPVPFLMHAKWAREDDVEAFNERACQRGALGVFPATDVLPLALAHAGRLTKYGA